MISCAKYALLFGGFVLGACGVPQAPEPPATSGDVASPAVTAEPRDMSDYNMDLARFVRLERGEAMEISIDKIKAFLKPEGEGNVTVSWETNDPDNGRRSFTGMADRMADDSVKAVEILAQFTADENENYTLKEYGARLKCWRGENADVWTIIPCP